MRLALCRRGAEREHRDERDGRETEITHHHGRRNQKLIKLWRRAAMPFLLRTGALLSTTLTLASAARGMPSALGGGRSLFRAPVARTLSALVLMSTPGEPSAPRRQREVDVRGFMVPMVNDVVRYPSKWPGEYLLGAVDYVQVLPEDRGYTVDVRPLRSVGGERWESKRVRARASARVGGARRSVRCDAYEAVAGMTSGRGSIGAARHRLWLRRTDAESARRSHRVYLGCAGNVTVGAVSPRVCTP